MNRLEEIEAREKAATPGRWESPYTPGLRWNDPMVCGYDSRAPEREAPYYCTGPNTPTLAQAEADSDFIAHARDDVPWLVAQVRERDAEIARLRAENARLRVAVSGLVPHVYTGLASESDRIRREAVALLRGESPDA